MNLNLSIKSAASDFIRSCYPGASLDPSAIASLERTFYAGAAFMFMKISHSTTDIELISIQQQINEIMQDTVKMVDLHHKLEQQSRIITDE